MTEKPTYEELDQIANERVNLKKQLKLLSLAVNQSSEGIAVIDLDGNLEYSNNAFAEMHGYSAEELVGKKISIFHTPEQMPHVEAVNLEIKQTGSFKGEIWHVKRDGTVFPTIMHNSLILDEANKPIGMMGTLRDISDIKQTDEALRESENKYRKLYEDAAIGIFHSTFEDRFLDVNPSLARMLGYETPQEVVDSIYSISEQIYVEPQVRNEVINKTLAQGGTVKVENLYRRKDGSEWDAYLYLRYVSDPNGQPICLEGFVEDITERKQAEEKLRQSRDLLVNLACLVPGVIYQYRLNPDGSSAFPWSSTGMNDIYEVTPEEVKEDATPVFRRLHPEDLEMVINAIQESARTLNTFYCELRVILPRQGLRWLWSQAQPERTEDGGTLWHGIILDITERKQAEEALRESESLKNTIIESSPDCIKLLDLEGNLMYMSNGGQGKLEIKDINIYLNNCWTDFWQGKDNINARMALDTAVKGGIGKFRGYSPTETGKPRWWDVIITPIWGYNGEVSQVLAVSRDITEQKLMEENLRQAQKMESIGTLTGGIAHDFNNIMGIILGNAELALEDVPEWNPAHSNLEEIKTAGLRAANIVRQLLSFTRITDQKLQPIEIALVIKDALKFLRSTIPTTIDIEQDISIKDETILADPTQINQIMMNLCINASHAMEQTGGKLTINVENVLLDDHSAKEYPDLKSGKYVKIVVNDTGSGVDPKIIDRIFDPYFTTKGVDKGSGMGLAVVHGIVKSHSGSITADSTLGKGTKFSILFPLAQGKAAVEEKTIQEIPKGTETILFVDDEISIGKMVQKMFERLGYKIQTAITPQDALDRFALNPDHFDLVITDMTMPQMTGVKLSEKLMVIRPDIPIIICTGHSALVDEEKAKELGLAAYIMKPIKMRETAQTIRKVLDRNKN